MSKSQPGSGKSSPKIGTVTSENGKKALEIGRIRALTEELNLLPKDAPLPDWTDVSVGNRLMAVARLIPSDRRERVLKKSTKQLARYQAGTEIPLLVVAAAAAETAIPLDWIVTGKAMDRLPPVVHIMAGAPNTEYADDVAVQKLAFKVAAGRGALILDDTKQHHYVPRFILQQAGVAPQNARLLESAGESMKPTINDGDLLLVDVSPAATAIVEGKIFVFSLDDEAYVKRLRRAGGKLIMVSDNREMFPPEEVPAESAMRIYGRVMWAGRNL